MLSLIQGIVGALCALIGLRLVAAKLRERHRAIESRGWPRYEGEVLESEIVKTWHSGRCL